MFQFNNASMSITNLSCSADKLDDRISLMFLQGSMYDLCLVATAGFVTNAHPPAHTTGHLLDSMNGPVHYLKTQLVAQESKERPCSVAFSYQK
jgi:hypothetical protein